MCGQENRAPSSKQSEADLFYSSSLHKRDKVQGVERGVCVSSPTVQADISLSALITNATTDSISTELLTALVVQVHFRLKFSAVSIGMPWT